MEGRYVITEYCNKRMGFLYEDNTLYEVHSFNDEKITGNIYSATVEDVVDNIDAAFISIGPEYDKCYYSLKDNANRHIKVSGSSGDKLRKGDTIIVQIAKEGIKSKKAEATADLSLTGKYVIVNRSNSVGVSSKIHNNEKRINLKDFGQKILAEFNDQYKFGLIIRTSADQVDEEIIKKETIILLCKLKDIIDHSTYAKIHSKVYSGPGAEIETAEKLLLASRYNSFKVITDIHEVYINFKNSNLSDIIEFNDNSNSSLNVIYNINKNVERALARNIYLKSGAYLVVDIAEAMTVIDVNTGKAINSKDKEEHILKINIEAAKAVARILRLKNLSGIIIVDFINLKEDENKEKLKQVLIEELSYDTVKCNFIDFTALGLAEITRKKLTRPLHEILS